MVQKRTIKKQSKEFELIWCKYRNLHKLMRSFSLLWRPVGALSAITP